MKDLSRTASLKDRILTVNVVVAALGYFVDIYDLVLFSIVRVPSLKSLNIAADQLLPQGVYLLNMQMIGMLIGGILWGVMGDRRGRISVLFGSIALYSLANIANAFVTTVPQYGVLRFLAGIGLAGELGAAVTLVAETLSTKNRGLGTSIVAGVGVSGAVVAALIGQTMDWKIAYIVGGLLGLALLGLRFKMQESQLFAELSRQNKPVHIRRGNFLALFQSRDRLLRYAKCILIGLPLWFVVGILVTFSPEISQALGVKEPLSAGLAIMYCYIGLVFGDFGSGLLSQWFKSRRKVVGIFLLMLASTIAVYLNLRNSSAFAFYLNCSVMGFFAGYWALFVTIAAEQFGSNLRATVSTTAPNFVRSAVVPMSLILQSLKGPFGLVPSVAWVGGCTLLIALIALYFLEESFHRDLDFLETHM